jgi:hypothetical protein
MERSHQEEINQRMESPWNERIYKFTNFVESFQ